MGKTRQSRSNPLKPADGLRHRALIGVMVYTFARVGAVLNLDRIRREKCLAFSAGWLVSVSRLGGAPGRALARRENLRGE